MSNNMRLPTLRQLERMGARDADATLDWLESQWERVLFELPKDGSHSATRRRVRAALYRVRNRRKEFFEEA